MNYHYHHHHHLSLRFPANSYTDKVFLLLMIILAHLLKFSHMVSKNVYLGKTSRKAQPEIVRETKHADISITLASM